MSPPPPYEEFQDELESLREDLKSLREDNIALKSVITHLQNYIASIESTSSAPPVDNGYRLQRADPKNTNTLR